MSAIDQAAARLVVDVGGTNTRIALYDPASDEYRALNTYRNNDYSNLEQIFTHWLNALTEAPPPICCIAAAAPPSTDRVNMLNIGWSFSCSDLASQFGFAQASWLNDFQANAYSLPYLSESDRVLLHPGASQAEDKLAVMGPGTGLGGACLEWINGVAHARDSEPGHMGLSPANALELEVFRVLLPRCGEIHAERLVSGPGLLLLYLTLAEIRNETPGAHSPAQVSALALQGDDSLAVQALDTFCELLGSACGDFVLANGAYGGLYLAGGIVPQISGFLGASAFADRFRDKGAMSSHLQAVPLYAISAAQPGLIGAAHAPIA